MAARARHILLSERRRTMALLRSTELGRDKLREMPSLKPEELADVDLDSPDALQEINERALREMIDGVLEHVPHIEASMIETVTVETDTTTASTRSFPDGSHLIMISDAMMTLVDLLGALTSAWSKSKGRTRLTSTVRRATQARQSTQLAESDPLILGGAAALRYYIVHQRLWASSAKVSTHVDGRTAMNDTERGLGAWALFYILAHELGHVALEHTRQPKDAETQRHNELAADDFAYPVCTRLFGGGKKAANITGIVATIAHCAIAISTNPMFVRTPETHPAFTVRLDRIAATYPTPMRTVVASYWGLIEMVSRGLDVATPLPEHYWTAMLERPEFDTRHHRANYFTLIRGMDMITGYTPQRAWRYIEGMTDPDAPDDVREEMAETDLSAIARALEHLAREDEEAAVDALGLRQPAAVLDRNLPLSYHALVEALLDSEALGGRQRKQGLGPRSAAFCLAHLVAPLITNSEDRQHDS